MVNHNFIRSASKQPHSLIHFLVSVCVRVFVCDREKVCVRPRGPCPASFWWLILPIFRSPSDTLRSHTLCLFPFLFLFCSCVYENFYVIFFSFSKFFCIWFVEPRAFVIQRVAICCRSKTYVYNIGIIVQ